MTYRYVLRELFFFTGKSIILTSSHTTEGGGGLHAEASAWTLPRGGGWTLPRGGVTEAGTYIYIYIYTRVDPCINNALPQLDTRKRSLRYEVIRVQTGRCIRSKSPHEGSCNAGRCGAKSLQECVGDESSSAAVR